MDSVYISFKTFYREFVITINKEEYLPSMRAVKKDPTFQRVTETQREFTDTEGFDWLESTELAIDKRKFLLNRLFVTQSIPNDED